MKKMIRSLLATTGAVLVGSVVLLSACSKGSTLGGTEQEPAAVETAGAPPVPEHAPEDADSHATATEPHPAGEEHANRPESTPATTTQQPAH